MDKSEIVKKRLSCLPVASLTSCSRIATEALQRPGGSQALRITNRRALQLLSCHIRRDDTDSVY